MSNTMSNTIRTALVLGSVLTAIQGCAVDTTDLETEGTENVSSAQDNLGSCAGDQVFVGDNALTGFSCQTFKGNLTISDVTSLQPLSALKKVEGSLTIQKSSFSSFSPLANLLEVGGDLYISECDSITNFSGFIQLSSVGGTLRITDTSATSTSGFLKLDDVYNISIGYNEFLANLNGFKNIRSVPGYVDLQANPSLTSVAGLGATEVFDYFKVWDCDALSEIDSSVAYIGTSFVVDSNDGLSRIGMQDLQNANGTPDIGRDLFIVNNSIASTSALTFSNSVTVGGTTTISGNR